MKNLVVGADCIVLPTTAQSRSVELTVEMSQMLRQYKVPYAALLVKVDARKEAAAMQATDLLQGFDIKVLTAQIPLLSAFEQAETEGVTVDQAIDKRGRANPRRMMGWTAYSAACKEIEGIFEGLRKQDQRQSPIGWDFTPMEKRNAA
jgi:chromosome partitioning protein